MVFRLEKPSDIEAISQITMAAFKDHPFSRQTEHVIVDALRRAGALSVSLVADIDGEVVGHIAFSPVSISDGSLDWYGLGPISVSPDRQRRGIGTFLVHEGLSMLKARGANGCALVGDPKFYRRFGFLTVPERVHEGVPQDVFLVLPFTGEVPKGHVVFHEGFSAKG